MAEKRQLDLPNLNRLSFRENKFADFEKFLNWDRCAHNIFAWLCIAHSIEIKYKMNLSKEERDTILSLLSDIWCI